MRVRFGSFAMLLAALTLTATPALAQEGTPGDSAAAPAAAGQPLSEERAMELGREYAQLVFDEDAETLWEHFDSDVREALGSVDGFRAMTQQIFAQTGPELTVTSEEVVEVGEQDIVAYRRVGHYATMGADAALIIAIRPDESIAGLQIRPVQ